MKGLAAATLLMVNTAEATNSVPITPTLPGWTLGNPLGSVDVRIWYELLCPDAQITHYQWQQLFEMDSPIPGKKYKEIINMRVIPTVLAFHVHAFQVTQIVPYLDMLCQQAYYQCYHDKYAEFAWDNKNWILAASDMSTDDFVAKWTTMVASKF